MALQASSLKIVLAEITKDDVKTAVESSVVDLVVHFTTSPKEEIAGVVLADGSSVRLYNEAKNRRAHFVVSPSQLKGLDVVAVYHSHPDGPEYPSPTDEKGIAPIPAVIVTSTSVILWWYAEHVGYYRIWDRNYGAE